MGAIDQSDVKVHVMKLSKEGFPNWHMKQLAFLIENSIGNAHANFNLDPKTTQAEFFTELYHKLIAELLEFSPDYRTYSSFGSAIKRKRPVGEDSNGSEKKNKISQKENANCPEVSIFERLCYIRRIALLWTGKSDSISTVHS